MARLYCRELLKGHDSSGRSSWAADEYYDKKIAPTPLSEEFKEKMERTKILKSGKHEADIALRSGEELHGKCSDKDVELRPGQIHNVLFGGDSRPCLIREVVADGTCTLLTEGGKILHGVLAKQLTPSKVTDRAIDKVSFSDAMRRALGQLGSAVDMAKLEVEQRVQSTLRHGPSSASIGDWALAPPEMAEGAPSQILPKVGAGRTDNVDRETDLDEESKKYLNKCTAGHDYQRSVESSNERRRKLRELFSTNVGYPVLVLIAIYGSVLLVTLTSLTMATKTSQLSRAVEAGRLKAIGALRITIGGLLCDSDEVAWEEKWRGGSYEECVRLNSEPAMCMKYGPLLFDAHDYDLNNKLDDAEALELIHMVHQVLLMRVAEGRTSVALLENEIMDIAIQIKSNGAGSNSAAIWNSSANGTMEGTAESIECVDDDASVVTAAAAQGISISGCHDVVSVCEDDSDVRAACPEACGTCSSNGTDNSKHELGCGMCHWDREDTRTFVCVVSQAVAAKEAVGGGFSESVAPLVIFTLLDQAPKDGYLSREELQLLTPFLAMAGPELAPALQQLLDRGFALADNDPRDQRLSQAEAGKLISDLQKMIPRLRRLSSAIVCVAAGADCDEALTGELLLDVLDLDGDGSVSKAEVNTYVVVLEVATGSPHLGPVGNGFFRAADANGDSYLDEARNPAVAALRASLRSSRRIRSGGVVRFRPPGALNGPGTVKKRSGTKSQN